MISYNIPTYLQESHAYNLKIANRQSYKFFEIHKLLKILKIIWELNYVFNTK